MDGNGRTARALFYWSMLSQGYWLIEFLSISRILRKAPVRYGRSFLYTETDDLDLTYFVVYQLEVARKAIAELDLYLRRKMEEISATERFMKGSAEFNSRQLALLSHALRHPGFAYTFKSHASSHNVAYETARNDLLGLERHDLLLLRQRGRAFYFLAPDDIGERVRGLQPGR